MSETKTRTLDRIARPIQLAIGLGHTRRRPGRPRGCAGNRALRARQRQQPAEPAQPLRGRNAG